MRKRRPHNAWRGASARACACPLVLLCLLLVAPLQSCKRKAVPRSAQQDEQRTEEPSPPAPRPTASPIMRRITAAWYHVPKDSLAKKRAAPDELTAAHNTLPIGTRLRVTNPENGRSVIVRITDRGIHDRRVKLDLCREAAAELGVVEKGFSSLRMQVLVEDAVSPGESHSIAAGD